MDFTAGITLGDGTVMTVDVTGIDAGGITYDADDGRHLVAWDDIDAVMLATTDHMLAAGGYLFTAAETMGQAQPYEAAEMKRRGSRLLAGAAPRLCPLGEQCGFALPPEASQSGA